MICTWTDLLELRANGRRPALPVAVTTSRKLGWNLSELGVMAIVHEPGEPMPVQLLEGLHVMLMFDRCDKAAAVWRVMKARDALPRLCESWCACESAMTFCAGRCTDARAADEIIYRRGAAA